MTGKAAFLIQNLAAGTTPASGTTAATSGLGYDRLNDPQPRHRARVPSAAPVLILDLGSAQSIDCAALLSTSLTSADTARVRFHTANSWGGAVAYDSGVLAAGCTDTKWNGNVVVCRSSGVSARYVRWDLVCSSPCDIGLAPVGLLFRPGRNFSFGCQEGRIDPSERTTNPDTGAEFGVALPTKRCKIISYAGLTKTEVRTYLDTMDRLAGGAGDILFVEDPTETNANLARDSIWGSYFIAGQSMLSQRNAFNAFQRSFHLTERL